MEHSQFSVLRALSALAGMAAFYMASPAWAQGQPEPGVNEQDANEKDANEKDVNEKDVNEKDASDQEVSEQDLAEIQAALGEDAAAMAESRPDTASPSRVPAAVQSLNPDIALIVDVAAAYFSDADHLQSGEHDPQATGFSLQQVELSLGKAVDPYFRVDANLVFGEHGAEVEEAYATTLALPWSLQARVGQFLTRIGRINASHPHSWLFVDQPFALGRVFGGEGNRGPGVELSYLTPLPWYVEIIASATGPEGEETARSFYGPDDMAVASPADLQWSFMIKQFFAWSDDVSLLWGLSAATAPNVMGRDFRSEVYATDVYVRYRPITRASHTIVTLQTEWFYRRRDIADVAGRGALADVSGYAQVFWQFARGWGVAARYEYGSPATNRAGGAGNDYLDPTWIDHRHRASASLTFWPTEFSRLRVQGSMDAPTWRENPIYALFAAMEFNIGAHGAHAF